MNVPPAPCPAVCGALAGWHAPNPRALVHQRRTWLLGGGPEMREVGRRRDRAALGGAGVAGLTNELATGKKAQVKKKGASGRVEDNRAEKFRAGELAMAATMAAFRANGGL